MAVEYLTVMMAGMVLSGLPIYMFGKTYWNPYKWAGFQSKMKKRSYGVVKFRSHGKNLYSKVLDISHDTVKTKFGLFVLENGSIYRMVGSPTRSKKKLKLELHSSVPQYIYDKHGTQHVNPKWKPPTQQKIKVAEIEDRNIEFEHGVPVITFDLDDMLPLYYASHVKSEENRNPRSIEQTLEKEVEVARMMAIKMTRKQLLQVVIITACLTLGAIGIGIINMNSTSELANAVQSLNNSIQSIPNAVIAAGGGGG